MKERTIIAIIFLLPVFGFAQSDLTLMQNDLYVKKCKCVTVWDMMIWWHNYNMRKNFPPELLSEPRKMKKRDKIKDRCIPIDEVREFQRLNPKATPMEFVKAAIE